LVLCLAALVVLGSARPALAVKIELRDPIGDDDGPGTYIYPTDPVYKPGSFDLTRFVVEDKGSTVTLSITVRSKLENPWEMESGFSVQLAMVFIDMDGVPGSGYVEGLPGLHIEFQEECAWEKAVVVSPQPASRVRAEILEKAADKKDDIIVPQSVVPRGKTFTAVIRKEDLGADVSRSWGWQVCVTSNEGFPGSNELLTRRVNEYEGQHRFGGGDDYDGDPHLMDILYSPAEGGPEEIEGQHRVVSAYVSGPDESKWVLARLPMVYPDRKGVAPAEAVAPPGLESALACRAGKGEGAAAPRPAAELRAGAFGFQASGKIYMNWLWGDATVKEASIYIGPFGQGGHQGANSELELNLRAEISSYVTAGARIKNRFRDNFWATYWDNKDLDKAQYMKLRGVWVRFRTPDWLQPYVSSVHLGSSDLAMFSPWTVGRIRYIDRDNASGTFLRGGRGGAFTYDLARISLPSLWAGPGWSTAGKGYLGYENQDGFINADYAYAAAFNIRPSEALELRIVGDYTHDQEGDPEDRDEHDGTDRLTRFENTVGSLEFTATPLEMLEVRGSFTYAVTNYAARFDYIHNRGGANNMPQKDCEDTAMTLTMELEDPFEVGLSFALEYFNVGEDFISLLASRREQDVLLTEGFEADDVSGPANAFGMDPRYAIDWGGWWGTRAQSPSSMPDNNETQFTETAYESIIGWKGGTLLLRYGAGSTDLRAEYTMIDYNTNRQDRDMTVYPSSQGIWFENQDRSTSIAVLSGKQMLGGPLAFYLTGKVKRILDEDLQDISISEDDYESDKMVYRFGVGFAPADELALELGYTLFDDRITYGGEDWSSKKNRVYLQSEFNFGGLTIGYFLEHFWGEDWIEDERYDDFTLTRSRAFLEVAF
jgi:hypothetical protein